MDSRAPEEKKEQKESALNRLPYGPRRLVVSFLFNKNKMEKPRYKQHAPLWGNTLFFDLNVYHAIRAAHNLLHRLEVNTTLEFIRENPQILFIRVEVKDFYGQRIRGKLVQILASAGEFNPIEMKAGAKHYGLVHLVGSCFPKEADFKSQIAERLCPCGRAA